MKRLTVITLLVLSVTLSFGQAFIDDVFNKYSGKEGFTSVMITPQLFKLITLLDKEDAELKALSEKISSLKILVSEQKSVGFTNEIRSKLKSGNYQSIMEIIDGKQKVDFFIKQNGERITDFILLSIDDTEEVLLSISGNLSVNELSSIGNSSTLGGKSNHISLLRNLEEK